MSRSGTDQRDVRGLELSRAFYAEALLATVDAPWLDEVLRRSPIGGVDLVSDNTDLLCDPALRAGILGLYDSPHARSDSSP